VNKQPFYHEATILFTATKPLSKDELEALLKTLKSGHVLHESFEVDSLEAEPGDPADLT
jgi:hypothetical protein